MHPDIINWLSEKFAVEWISLQRERSKDKFTKVLFDTKFKNNTKLKELRNSISCDICAWSLFCSNGLV